MILISILFLLISNAVTLRRDIAILFNRVAIIIILYSILHNITSFSMLNSSISLHGGLIYINNITQIFQIFILIITFLILNLTSFFPEVNLMYKKVKTYVHINLFSELGKGLTEYNKHIPYKKEITDNIIIGEVQDLEHLKIIEYPLILLFIITGSIFLISTNDLISIFLAIELQSYGLYLLSTINRNSELSTTGGLIYFLLGGLSSCFILLGTSLLYANSGTTNIDGFYIITSISENSNISDIYKPDYISFSLLIFSIGFLFKISAAPFHFWSPDVYDAIPTVVTTFVAILAKISIFIFLLELVYYTSNYFFNFNWIFGLLMSSFFSLIIGTVVGLTQFRIKRLLAYSTISHIGFILLALGISSVESTQAFIFYLIQYSISNLNIFLILILIGYSLHYYVSNNKEYKELLEKNYSPIQLISQLKGYYYINPILSLSLIITIFSFAGIPPLIGFFAKQMVLSAALDKGFIFLSLVAIITSVIGAVYYLNIVKEIYFNLPMYKSNCPNNKLLPIKYTKDPKYNSRWILHGEVSEEKYEITISNVITIIISIITLLILLFIFINKEWLSMGTILVQILFNY